MHMKLNFRRLLAMFLSIMMVVGMLPTMVLAEDAVETPTYVANVNGTECSDADALISALNAASGEVTVEIYDKITIAGLGLNNANITELSFVGKGTDAEICVDGVSYIDVRYTSYPIEYTSLILSHINAGQNIDGFLPQYFSTYNGGNVTYTSCTFPNGVTACGSTANTTYTFNQCTFNNTTSGLYSLWVYGNSTNVVINGGTFSGVRGIKMYSEGSNDFSTLSVTGATFSNTITEKHAIVLTKGESITLTGNTFENTTGTVQVDDDYASSIEGKTVTIDGKAYTVNSADTKLDEVAPEVTYVAEVNGVCYKSLDAALDAAQAGDTIILLCDIAEDVTVPAGVIFNGNGKQVGVITAAGEITFKGYTKATNFGVQNTNTTIHIGEGACLEITGTDRMVIGHGCTFNITGTITNAKTANTADLTPSLIMPGASFTGAGVTFNVTNAYIKAPSSYCSSSKTASGTFDFNITNSIIETAGKLAFEAQSTDATVNFELKDSVLTTGSHLVFGVSRGEIVIDNSNVNVGTSKQIENQSTMIVKNDSVVNGAVATSSNAKNPGTLIIDNATYAVTGEFSGSDLGTGTLIVNKGASFTAGSITKANIQIDATGMQADDEININADLSKLAGTIEVVNSNLGAEIVDGKIVLVEAGGLSGTGTAEDPYLINNLEDLIWFRDSVNTYTQDGSNQYKGKYVKLTADIDLAGINWEPIGKNTQGDHQNFLGTFDGGDHTISNLTINGTDYLGFFANVGASGDGTPASVKNLTFNNVKISGTGNYVGTVIANGHATTTVENVHVTGTIDISGNGYIGGIVGHAYVKMNNVSVKGEGTIKSTFWCCGGILGYAGEGSTNITNATVEGTGNGLSITSAAGALGAIVGRAEDNNGTQPISGSNLSAKNVAIKTYTGAYGDGYANNGLGYLYGGNPTSKLTGTLTVENVTVETSTGVTPAIVDAVASVNGTIYFDLQDAENAAKDSDTIVLLRDIELNDKVTFYNAADARTVTLDMNGKTITLKADWPSTTSPSAFWVCDGLTITGNGTINAAPAGEAWAYAIVVGHRTAGTTDGYVGTLVIENGTFYSDNASVVSVTNGSVTINGGTFEAAGDMDLNCIDDMYNAGKASITVYGGTFVGFNPADNAAEGTGTNFVADGYEAKDNGNGTYSVAKKVDYAAWVKEQLLAGNSVTLDRDIVITDYELVNALVLPSNGNGKYTEVHGNGAVFHITKPGVVLDLNGHSITWDAHHDDYCNKRQVSLFFVTITGNAGETSNFTVKDSVGTGKVDVYGMGTGMYVVGVDAVGTIEGGTWTNYPCNTCAASNIFLYPTHGGTMNITGGTFEQKDSDYLLGWKGSSKPTTNNGVGIDQDATKMVISGGTFVNFNPENVKFFDTANSGQTTIDGCAPGYEAKNNGDGTYGVVAIPVAELNGTKYTSLQDAIDKAQNNDTITVLTDINLANTDLQLLDNNFDTYFLVEGKTVTIDLNGKIISGEYTGTNTMLVGVFSTDNGGHLTLTGNGTVNVTATNKVYSLIANYEDGCTITIENGTYTLDKASDSLVYSGGYTDAAVTVKDGTFTLGNVGTGENGKPWIFNVLGAGDHHVLITGGTFNADINRQYWSNEAVVDKACYVVNNGNGTWTVMPGAVAYVNVGMLTGPYYAPKDVGFKTFEEVLEAIKAEENAVITLLDNVTLDITAWETLAIGRDDAKTITIKGNGKTLTFNKLNSDWDHITTKNGAKLILNNLTITDRGYNDGPWNRYDLVFACDVELNNVTSTKALAFKADATLNNVTISDANTSDTYAIWIQPNGQTVTITNSTIDMLACSDGRGIKIDNQYVDAAAEEKVTLNVSNTSFKTEEKAAILVKSTKGADIALDNVDISGVAADTVNAVWNDEDNADYFDKITVTGGTIAQEGAKAGVAKIGETMYETLAEALSAAGDGDTITLIWAEGDAPIAMNGAVYGKTVTIAGTAIVDWSKGNLFVGRGGEGNGTVIFDNAKLTSASNSSSYGIHVSGRQKNTADKYDGTLVIKNSTIELDYLINRGTINVDNSTLTVKNGFGIAGRPASETESGTAATATVNITNGSYVKVLNHNGMGVGVAAAINEGYGVLNLTDSTFECASFNINGDKLDSKTLGDFNVYGESTLKINTLTGREIDLHHNAIIKDSTVGGEVMLYGKVTFRGDNTFAMLYDYGAAYSTDSAEWLVEKDASVTLTEKARYGLGYGDKVTIYGSLTDALNARDTLGESDIAVFMHGLVAQESTGWNKSSSLTVKDAYVVLGSNNSFGNKPGNYGGTYTFEFDNVVLDSSRITFYEAGSTTKFTFNESDVKVGTFMIRDADSVFTLTDTKLESTTTFNGTDEGNYLAGTLVLNNSSLSYAAPLVMESGSLTLGAGSSLTADSIIGTGKIIIDATGMTAGKVATITTDASAFTGTLEVINNEKLTAEIDANGNIVLVAKEAELFDIAKTNMIMGQNLALMFAFEKSNIADADLSGYVAKVSIAYKDDRGTVNSEIVSSNWTTVTIGGVDYWCVTVSNLAAKEMDDDVTVTIYKGEEAISKAKTMSLRQYGEERLAASTDNLFKTTVVDMLNYGAEAQKYFEYNEDNLANRNISAYQNLATTTVTLDKTRNIISDENNHFIASNVTFTSDIAMLFAIARESTAVSGKITFVNHKNGTVTTFVDSYEEIIASGKAAKKFVFTGMVVADIDQVISVEFYDAEGNVVISLTDSLDAYLGRVGSTSRMKALADSFGKFSTSAYAYLHK